MSSNVISLADVVKTLRTSRGDDDTLWLADQSIITMMQTVLDFTYEDGVGANNEVTKAEDFMLEDMHEVMSEAEDAGTKKTEAVRDWLQEIIDANKDLIESAFAAADSH